MAYHLGEREFSNLGLAGPATHAFATDMMDLPYEDVYAAFAGWHVEHEDIYQVPAEHFQQPHQLEAVRLIRRLQDEGYDAIQPQVLAFFLGEKHLAALAVKNGSAGVVVGDYEQSYWLPSLGQHAPGAREALWIFQGRKLLQSFNDISFS